MSTVVSTSAITASINFEAPEVIYVDEADIFCGDEKVPETYKEVLGFFQKRFDDAKEDDAGFMSVKGSVGIYVEDADEDEYDTILFAKKDHYSATDI